MLNTRGSLEFTFTKILDNFCRDRNSSGELNQAIFTRYVLR